MRFQDFVRHNVMSSIFFQPMRRLHIFREYRNGCKKATKCQMYMRFTSYLIRCESYLAFVRIVYCCIDMKDRSARVTLGEVRVTDNSVDFNHLNHFTSFRASCTLLAASLSAFVTFSRCADYTILLIPCYTKEARYISPVISWLFPVSVTHTTHLTNQINVQFTNAWYKRVYRRDDDHQHQHYL